MYLLARELKMFCSKIDSQAYKNERWTMPDIAVHSANRGIFFELTAEEFFHY
jgi:hypothetical protein